MISCLMQFFHVSELEARAWLSDWEMHEWLMSRLYDVSFGTAW